MISTVTSTTAAAIIKNSMSLTSNKIVVTCLLILFLLIKEIIRSIEDSQRLPNNLEGFVILKQLTNAAIIPFMYVFIIILISKALSYMA